MSKGQHRPGYRQPLTGEPRKTRQPLRIDSLSQSTRDAILKARADGATWKETAELASKTAGESLAPSVVHRWYDLRVEQPASLSASTDLKKRTSLIADLIFERLKVLLAGRAA
jgi:hypothetical protein